MDMLRDKRRQDELLKVAEQAAGWLIALEEPTAEERAAFAEWIQESQLHVEMFLRAGAVGQMGELLSPQDRSTLTAASLSAVDTANVFPLDSHKPARSSTHTAKPARFSRRTALGAAAATAAIAVGLFGWWQLSWQRYTTGIGEQRSISLEDGSIVYVNTSTRVDVSYSAHARTLRLVGGEALFKVEPDPVRPFRVHVDGTVVEAVGTQFNIYRKPGHTTVAVVEGIVKAGDTPLRAGQAVNIAANGRIGKPGDVDIGQITAWRQRRLVFEWETLGTIAAEFNRYNRTPRIRVEGAEAGARRYTAVFEADNPRTLLRFLGGESKLVVTNDGDDLVIRTRRN